MTIASAEGQHTTVNKELYTATSLNPTQGNMVWPTMFSVGLGIEMQRRKEVSETV